MAALFTAADVSSLEASIAALLLVGVTIGLLYAGYKHVRKGMAKI